MEQELEHQLYISSKQELVKLIQELIRRYPVVLTDVTSILEGKAIVPDLVSANSTLSDEISEEVTEDWDFTGEESLAPINLWEYTLTPLDSEACRQHIEGFAQRLSTGEPTQVLAEEMSALLDNAELRAEQHDYAGALDIYALLLDERLATQDVALAQLLDEAFDEALLALENVLSEASSNATFDATTVTLSPLLTANVRHQWLERLFALWLKRLDIRRVEEDVPEMMFMMAWNEDMLLLRNLVQQELQRLPQSEHPNIVDFHRQFRTRALERFLRELPHL